MLNACSFPSGPRGERQIRDTAALWIARRDRGLLPHEEAELNRWLAADPRHAAALTAAEKTWRVLNLIPAEFTEPSKEVAPIMPGPGRWCWLAGGCAAAVAALAIFLLRDGPSAKEPFTAPPNLALAAESSTRLATLPDGSTVHLNRGGALKIRFSAAERRVELLGGEAHFTVAKHPGRVFIVRAGDLEVRAVGTAFNVHLSESRVEVIVTEGRVQLATAAGDEQIAGAPVVGAPMLDRGHRAVLPVSFNGGLPARLVVSRMEAAEIAEALAWQGGLIRLGGSTLAELAAQFEQRTGRRIVLADPELASLQVGGQFRADDIEGFTALLASTYDIELQRQGDTFVLRKKSSSAR